jgi:hypothetical protein
MTDAGGRKRTAKKPELKDQFASLLGAGGAPAPAEPSGDDAADERARKQPAPSRKRTTPATMPAAQEKPAKYSARLNATMTEKMRKELKMAGVEDGIDDTVRIRAMITVWSEHPNYRRMVDKVAKDLQRFA